MKRIGILSSLMLLGFFENVSAALPTGATLFDVNVPSLCGGPTFGMAAINYKTNQTYTDYALTYRPFNDETFFPRRDNGRYQNVVPESSWAYKFDVGFIFPCSGNNLNMTYLTYHQNAGATTILDHFNAIIFPSLSDEWPTFGSVIISDPSLVLSPVTLFEPGGFVPVATEPNIASAHVNVNQNVFDLDAGQYINLGWRTRIRFFGGVRYLNLKNKFDVIYRYIVIDPNTIVLSGVAPNSEANIVLAADYTEAIFQSSTYQGTGPRLGIDATYYMRWGFGLVSSLSASLLVGEITTNLGEEFNKYTAATIFESNIGSFLIGTLFQNFTCEGEEVKYPRAFRVVPNFDAKLGIDYSYQWCKKSHTKLNLEIGYRVSHYFNVLDRISELTFDNPAIGRAHTLSQHFEGFYLGFQVNL